jgi:hypothetical protein
MRVIFLVKLDGLQETNYRVLILKKDSIIYIIFKMWGMENQPIHSTSQEKCKNWTISIFKKFTSNLVLKYCIHLVETNL